MIERKQLLVMYHRTEHKVNGIINRNKFVENKFACFQTLK